MLIVIVPYLIWVSFLYFIIKWTKQQPLVPWIEQHCGRGIAWGIRIVFILYGMSIAALTLEETVTWTHVSYMPRTPEFALALSLSLLCIFAAYYGIQAIAITSGVLLPFVVILGDFVMSANLPAKDYSLLFPVLIDGWMPVLDGTIYIGGGLVELILILFLQHHLKTKVKLWAMWLLALFLVLLMLGPVTGAITEFGPFEAAKLRYPAYEEWRLVSIGKYIHHVDFLSIYQWLSGAFIRISSTMYIAAELMPFQKNKDKLAVILLFAFFILIFVLIPISDMEYLSFWKQIHFPFSLIFIMAISFLLFILVWFTTFKNRRKYQ